MRAEGIPPRASSLKQRLVYAHRAGTHGNNHVARQ